MATNYRAVCHGQLLRASWSPTDDGDSWQTIMASWINNGTAPRPELFTGAQERGIIRVNASHTIPDPDAAPQRITISKLQIWCSLGYDVIRVGETTGHLITGLDDGLHYMRYQVQKKVGAGAWATIQGMEEAMPDSGLLVHANSPALAGTIGILPAYNSSQAMTFYRAMTVPLEEAIVIETNERLRVQARVVWPSVDNYNGAALEYDGFMSGKLG